MNPSLALQYEMLEQYETKWRKEMRALHKKNNYELKSRLKDHLVD